MSRVIGVGFRPEHIRTAPARPADHEKDPT